MATTYKALNTGTNRKGVIPSSQGDAVVVGLLSGQTMDTTTLIATDFQELWDVPNGAKLWLTHLEVADPDTHGTETLDMDLILRDDDGDTILFNAGTAFEDAYDDWIELLGQYVNADNSGYATVGFYINTAAATGVAAASVKGTLFYQ